MSDTEPRVLCISCEVDIEKEELEEYTHDDESYCEECFYEDCYICDDCGLSDNRDNAYYIESQDSMVCESCYGDGYFMCSSCDTTDNLDSSYWSESNGEYYCESCYPSEEIDYGDPPDALYPIERIGRTYKKNKRRRLVGIECEVEGVDIDVWRDDGHSVDGWSAVSDGSLSNTGIEFISNPPSSGDTLYNNIDNLNRYVSENFDYFISQSCGMHVHVNALDVGWNELKHILYVARKLEPLLYAMQPETRRKSRWCKPIFYNSYDIRNIRSWECFQELWYQDDTPSTSKYNETRYHGLNLHARAYLGTIEFRYHTGSLNPRKIKAWSEICTAIVDTGIDLCNIASWYNGEPPSSSNIRHRDMIDFFIKKNDIQINTTIDRVSSLLNLTDNAKKYMTDRVNQFNEPNSTPYTVSRDTKLGQIYSQIE
tara:strand:+ start:4310 stop:5587 length:1278 start_codon:yes stop_codon:yes gene_type:complete